MERRLERAAQASMGMMGVGGGGSGGMANFGMTGPVRAFPRQTLLRESPPRAGGAARLSPLQRGGGGAAYAGQCSGHAWPGGWSRREQQQLYVPSNGVGEVERRGCDGKSGRTEGAESGTRVVWPGLAGPGDARYSRRGWGGGQSCHHRGVQARE